MIKDGKPVLTEEMYKRGCHGCPHYIITPSQMIEDCDLPGNECTYGER